MIKVKVPATTANLCIGYDCLGMALDWWSTFTFEQSTQLRITGCDPRFQTIWIYKPIFPIPGDSDPVPCVLSPVLSAVMPGFMPV